ncbi:MAG: hypothetical protein QM478_13255 [Flavobacteriaceae bacterium]
MIKKGIFILFCIFFTEIIFAQVASPTSFKNGINNPSTVTLHPFGIFSSRINQNFKIRPTKKMDLNFSIASANTFLPFVEAYYPEDPVVRETLSQVVWYDRRFTFIDQETTPAAYTNIVIDAVVKEFRVDFNLQLAKEHELKVSLRSYLITKGKTPSSLLTSDDFLEWFHSNIAGGEDPFGRKFYGLNQVDYKYTDRNGEVLELNSGDFFVGGIELNYFYYPEFLVNQKRNFFVNFGSHIGINTSKYNPSMDFGFSGNVIKTLTLKNDNQFNFALGLSILRKNIIDFDTVVELGNNKYLGSLEAEVEYTSYTKKKNYHSFGILYQLQTSYNKKEEADYYKLLGQWSEINAGWHNGVTTLHQYLSNWTFVYGYATPKFKIYGYIKEDLDVNNAPDLQTSIGVQFPIGN